LTQVSLQSIEAMKKEMKSGKTNPINLKKLLAFEVVKMLYGKKDAKNAEKEFKRVAQKGERPSEIPYSPKAVKPGNYPASKLSYISGATIGTAEAKRLINQGAVEYEGERIQDPQETLTVKGDEILKVGKRKFFKIKKK